MIRNALNCSADNDSTVPVNLATSNNFKKDKASDNVSSKNPTKMQNLKETLSNGLGFSHDEHC